MTLMELWGDNERKFFMFFCNTTSLLGDEGRENDLEYKNGGF